MAIQSNQFYGAGGGAVAIENGKNTQITNNDFFDNMREVPWSPAAGGQAVAHSGASERLLLYNNTLNGNNQCHPLAGCSLGFELNGRYLRIESNYIQFHRNSAISLESTKCVKVQSNVATSGGGDPYIPPAGMIIIVSNVDTSQNILLANNYVHGNSDPGFYLWTGGWGASNVEYFLNTNNTGQFYSNMTTITPNPSENMTYGPGRAAGGANGPSGTFNSGVCTLIP